MSTGLRTLVLTRKLQQTVEIEIAGIWVEVRVTQLHPGRCSLAISAPAEVRITRPDAKANQNHKESEK